MIYTTNYMKKSNIYLGIVVFLAFLIQGIFSVSDYGLNWDETAHYLRGQAYARYFLTGKTDYADLPKIRSHYPTSKDAVLPNVKFEDDSFFRRSLYQYDREGEKFTFPYYIKYDKGHPPLNGILASFSNILLYQKLGLVGDIESYHLFTIFISSVLVASIFLFVAYFYGKFAAIIAVFSLALYPLFFSESHFNIKDPVEATFYSLTLFAFYIGIIKGKWKWIIISGIFGGFALGTKFNIIFVVFTLAAWLALYYWKSIRRLSWPFSKSLTVSFVLCPCIALSILYISWPYLWQNPNNIIHIFSYYSEVGIFSYQPHDYYFFGFNTYAIQWILYTTPLVTLLFTFFGFVYVLTKGRGEKEKTALLILIWFLIPILRVTVPQAGIYGGVRQIMEFIPAMAMLSGLGASYIVKQFSNATIKQSYLKILIILSFLPITLKLIAIHPNENVYFNPLIGGLEGAKNRNFADWGNSFGNAYRQGIYWVNKHAEKNATLVLAQELMPNLPRIFVREDIAFSNTLRSGYLKKGEYVIGLNFGSPLNMSYYSSRFYHRTLLPVYEIKVDNTAILTVWKNDSAHTKKNYNREEKLENTPYRIIENGIKISFDKILTLSRIGWTFQEKECSNLEQAYFEISTNGENWERVPHVLPDDIPIPVLSTQPKGNSIEFPFGAERALTVFVRVEPKDACIKKIKSITTYYYSDAT